MLHRSAEDAVWDVDAVHHELQAILDAGLDLDLSGFEPAELDGFLNADVPLANASDASAEFPQTGTVAISQPGDVWLCGPHIVGCGDPRDLDFVRHVCGGRVANVCFAAPRLATGLDRPDGRHFDRNFGEGASPEACFAFLRDVLRVLKASSAGNALIYAGIDWRHSVPLLIAAEGLALPLASICVWAKNHPSGAGLYADGHELIAVFHAGPDEPVTNLQHGKRGRRRSNVWSYPSSDTFGAGTDEFLGAHSTTKPIALISDVLRDVTRRGDLILYNVLGPG